MPALNSNTDFPSLNARSITSLHFCSAVALDISSPYTACTTNPGNASCAIFSAIPRLSLVDEPDKNIIATLGPSFLGLRPV